MVEQSVTNQERPKEFPLMPVRKRPGDFIPDVAIVPEHTVSEDRRERPEVQNRPKGESEGKQNTVTLHGTVIERPKFRKSKKNGIDIMEFQLNLSDGEEGSVMNVVFFGERVDRVKSKIAAGKELNVKGYPHVTERKGRDGKPYHHQELYGVALLSRAGTEVESEQLGLGAK